MKVSDYICKRIKNLSDYAFVGHGSSILHLLYSAKKYKIKLIPSQNEQCASIAADAYSRCSSKIGVSITTSGPGTLNAFQGIACSYYDSVPSIFLSGTPIKKFLMKKKSKLRQLGFQEMDMENITKKFTKYQTRITNPNNTKFELDKAISIAKSGRPGPCLIEIPDDVQRSPYIESAQKIYNEKRNKFRLSTNKISSFERLVRNSKKPLIIAGYGVKRSNYSQQLMSWAKLNQIPYVLTYASADIANSKDELNAGPFGVYATKHGNLAVQNSDLLIILGCKLNPTLMGTDVKKFSPKSKKIHVDFDLEELKEQNHLKTDLKIYCNLETFLKKINKKKISITKNKFWINQINKWKSDFPTVKKEYFKEKKYVNPYYFFDRLSFFLKKDSIIINDTSNNMVWMHQSFMIKKGQNVFSAYNHSPMGYSVPASIGAHLGDKKKELISIVGDGGFQMNIQELQTIYFYKIPVKIFIIQNKTLGMVTQAMDTWFKSDYVALDEESGFSLPDFKKVVNSYRIKTFEIKNNSQVNKRLNQILKFKGPCVTIINVSKKARMIPKVKIGEPIDKI